MEHKIKIDNASLISANIAVWSLVAILLLTTGCMAPMLLGVKEVRTAGGTEVKFITGADFRVGANGVDTVEDNRGIRPSGQAPRVSSVKAYN